MNFVVAGVVAGKFFETFCPTFFARFQMNAVAIDPYPRLIFGAYKV